LLIVGPFKKVYQKREIRRMPYAREVYEIVEIRNDNGDDDLLVCIGYNVSSCPSYVEYDSKIYKCQKVCPYGSTDHPGEEKYGTTDYAIYSIFDLRGVTG